MKQIITIQDDGWIAVRLTTNREAIEERRGEVILDVNEMGNWVHGFELVGGFVDFSVEKASRPFHPEPPDASKTHRRRKAVTYDQAADAAFFHLDYEPELLRCSGEELEKLMRVSLGINPTAFYGLDKEGGLVWVKIPTADVTGPVTQFLALLKKQ